MKTENRGLGTGALLVLILTLGFGAAAAGEDPPEDPRLAFYADRLTLSPEQTDQLNRVLSVDRELARIDRERFRGQPSDLAEATQKRISGTNKEIEAVLSAEQKLLFETIKPSDRLGEGVLNLTARLGLDPSQTRQLEGIMVGSQVEGLRAQMRSAGSDRDARMEYMQDMRTEMERLDKEIEKILTAEQMAEYRKIKDERKAQMEAQRPEGREGKGQGRGGRRGGGGQGW